MYYKLIQTRDDEYEFQIPHWTMRGITMKLRIFRLNGTDFAVVMPGLSGSFAYSYKYQFSMPLRGTGPVKIGKAVEEKWSMHDFYVSDIMLQETVAGINEARKKLVVAK